MRLLTRSDFDGSVCAAILEELGIVDEILYIHPKDMQDHKIEVTKNDAYGDKLKKFEGLIKIVAIADSAQFTKDDILNPQGWTMLAFITDPRTGLGHKHNFRMSNFDLMKSLPKLLRTKSVEEILAIPDFQERVQLYHEENEKYKNFLSEIAQIEGSVILIDLRGREDVTVGNRFMEYILFPEQNISLRIADGRNKEFAPISVGQSILNKTSSIDVGALTLRYGGGGHKAAGTCQVKYEDVDKIVKEMLQTIHSKE